jgi:hypothetical protein
VEASKEINDNLWTGYNKNEMEDDEAKLKGKHPEKHQVM